MICFAVSEKGDEVIDNQIVAQGSDKDVEGRWRDEWFGVCVFSSQVVDPWVCHEPVPSKDPRKVEHFCTEKCRGSEANEIVWERGQT